MSPDAVRVKPLSVNVGLPLLKCGLAADAAEAMRSSADSASAAMVKIRFMLLYFSFSGVGTPHVVAPAPCLENRLATTSSKSAAALLSGAAFTYRALFAEKRRVVWGEKFAICGFRVSVCAAFLEVRPRFLQWVVLRYGGSSR